MNDSLGRSGSIALSATPLRSPTMATIFSTAGVAKRLNSLLRNMTHPPRLLCLPSAASHSPATLMVTGLPLAFHKTMSSNATARFASCSVRASSIRATIARFGPPIPRKSLECKYVEAHANPPARSYEPCNDLHQHHQVDPETDQVLGQLPQCPRCLKTARPNVMMFGDWHVIYNRIGAQVDRFNDWKRTVASSGVCARITTVLYLDITVLLTQSMLVHFTPRR
jgi:hypothetical protein